MKSYESTAEELARRIADLIPYHPEILEMKSAWDLFSLKRFKCDDLQPSMFQAEWALRRAQKIAASPTTARQEP